MEGEKAEDPYKHLVKSVKHFKVAIPREFKSDVEMRAENDEPNNSVTK